MADEVRYELGLIGAGNMAKAIVKAAITKGVLKPAQIAASDPSLQCRELMSRLGVTVTSKNQQVIERSKQLLIAVKPQIMQEVAADLAAHAPPEQVIVTIMAGISTAKLCAAIGRDARVVRVMPNTPMLVGLGMAGVALGEHTEVGDESLAMRLFGAAGQATLLEESKLDAVTAVSGSGPAYVFYLAQAMQEAALDLGLGDEGDLFVLQTIVGAAMMMAETGLKPILLRQRVTSPGGTTEAAINFLERNNVSSLMVDAIKAAHQRANELGESES